MTEESLELQAERRLRYRLVTALRQVVTAIESGKTEDDEEYGLERK